ncbi:glycoside hydrolase family 15 protein [Streptomyces sp. NPDC101132]|uniref:glycoside hydrolase family 15 protein n=1 Tax=Streptomyces sp. NPDC101132 TaxID=3366110 RepID=UPI003801BC7E
MSASVYGHTPRPLRDYALLADGERGALADPAGDIVWMCAPRWHSGAVFSELTGGSGHFAVAPEGKRSLPCGWYEEGTLIRTTRWTGAAGVVECRDALAAPGDPHRAVLLRRIRAVQGPALVRVELSIRARFGAHPMTGLHRDRGYWVGRSGPLSFRLRGVPENADATRPGVPDTVTALIALPAGGTRDLVLEIADARGGSVLSGRGDEAARLWRETERYWAAAVPDCTDLTARSDARHAYAVLTGLTARTGAMVAAAANPLPEQAAAGGGHDHRYAWVRDQCFAGTAVAAHGPHRLLDDAVRVVTARVLEYGPDLHAAYRVDGRPVPREHELPLAEDAATGPAGTPAGGRSDGGFQLDTFGEVLELLAAAARRDRLDDDGERAAEVAVSALEGNWQRPDGGLWDLYPAWWTHSRLAAVSGLRAAVRDIAPRNVAFAWSELADTILHETERTCLHWSGRWQRSRQDPGVDAALLRPLARGGLPPAEPALSVTRQAVQHDLARDGFVHRFRPDGVVPGRPEGASLACGFLMTAACLAEDRPAAAARWFERTRSAYGPPGLFAQEYDVERRELRGNLPGALVHALLLDSTVRLTAADQDVAG